MACGQRLPETQTPGAIATPSQDSPRTRAQAVFSRHLLLSPRHLLCAGEDIATHTTLCGQSVPRGTALLGKCALEPRWPMERSVIMEIFCIRAILWGRH